MHQALYQPRASPKSAKCPVPVCGAWDRARSEVNVSYGSISHGLEFLKRKATVVAIEFLGTSRFPAQSSCGICCLVGLCCKRRHQQIMASQQKWDQLNLYLYLQNGRQIWCQQPSASFNHPGRKHTTSRQMILQKKNLSPKKVPTITRAPSYPWEPNKHGS